MRIGIIGGSGVYDIDGMDAVTTQEVETPFGSPSDVYVCGTLGGVEAFFLPRHGKGHRLLPSEINHRANIYGFKCLGVERILSVSAVGSLREELRPRDVVLPDQYFDRTKHALDHTFFGNGLVAHVGFGDPTCAELRAIIRDSAQHVVATSKQALDVRVNECGTYVNMEGPAFSTRAESEFYRRQGFDVIGMTSLPEAKLCREAEICYQAMAMVTDYDCWRESEDAVTVESLVGHLKANTALARQILSDLMPRLGVPRTCSCGSALASAILNQPGTVAAETREKLAPIIGKYIP
jgi:5'-methylthioadenosine phosphorylase